MRIAVVEDNPDNMLLVQAMLEDRYQLDCYFSGIEALEAMDRSIPDLILLDISLPELDGPAVLQRIREHRKLAAVHVIALTAHAMSGDREKFLSLGFDDYISKPILDAGVLIEAIEKHLSPRGDS